MKKGLLIIGITVFSLMCSCAIFIDDDDDDDDCAFHDDTDSINITIYSNYPMLP